MTTTVRNFKDFVHFKDPFKMVNIFSQVIFQRFIKQNTFLATIYNTGT